MEAQGDLYSWRPGDDDTFQTDHLNQLHSFILLSMAHSVLLLGPGTLEREPMNIWSPR